MGILQLPLPLSLWKVALRAGHQIRQLVMSGKSPDPPPRSVGAPVT